MPLAERKAKVLAFLEIMRAQNDEIVPELAMQMGRPVRYGGELRSLEERVRTLVELSDEALAPTTPAERPGFRRMIKRVPAGLVLVIAPWNYPYLTAVNAIGPGTSGGQCRHPEARRADAAGRRALPGGHGPGRVAEGPVPQRSTSIHGADRKADRVPARSTMSTSPARSPAAAPSSGPRPAPSPRSVSSSAARIRPMCAPTPSSIIAVENILSTAPSTIPASAAAASSASMCTSRSMTISSTASPISPATM